MAPRVTPSTDKLRRKFNEIDGRLALLETTGVPAASVQEAVDNWLEANPPAAGQDGEDGQDGTNGTNGVDGQNGADAPAPTPEQIQAAVDAYIAAHPPAAGRDGEDGEDGQDGQPGANATPAQIATAVAAYLTDNPPAAGKDGKDGVNGTNGTNGTNGSPANTLAGTVQIGQNAVVAIALGIREVTVALTGAVVGERYQAHCRRFKLNGAASWTAGRPAGYTVLDCVSNTAGNVTVSINAPLLAIGASYILECDIVKVNT